MAQYYIGKNNQRLGPFPVEQLIANGITPDTLVWCSGMPGWKKAIDVPEVAISNLTSSPISSNSMVISSRSISSLLMANMATEVLTTSSR